MDIAPEHIGNVKVTRPQTGAEYRDLLRDDRTVYIYGERVKDVTTHPAFRNTARMVVRLYDALHDDKRKHKLLLPTGTGNGGMTHAFFKAPKTVDDMIAGREAIAEWAKITYGWLGRAPDYKAAFLATLGANSDFYDPPSAGTSSARSAAGSKASQACKPSALRAVQARQTR
ncbi:4-hydroxyphenylacetate 3-hydroxylase N-terminal domain-containing protein [Bradyrhizobium sp. UFLA05-112]